jgi:putative acetyltransferase
MSCEPNRVSSSAAIIVERRLAPTADAMMLIAELDAVLGGAYAPEQRHGLSIAQVFEPHIRFFVAHIEGTAVGCGALALFADYAEVKRMYTRAAVRGRGVGKAVLGRLEREARSAGLPMLCLETGIHQAAAIALYEAWGFRRCDAFGAYAEMPPHRIATSVFYQKLL